MNEELGVGIIFDENAPSINEGWSLFTLNHIRRDFGRPISPALVVKVETENPVAVTAATTVENELASNLEDLIVEVDESEEADEPLPNGNSTSEADEVEADAKEDGLTENFKNGETVEERREMLRFILEHRYLRSIFRLNSKLYLQKDDILKLRQEFNDSLEEFVNIWKFLDKTTPADLAPANPPTITKIDKLKIVNWNVGMLEYPYLKSRSDAIANFILKEGIDVVLLQELNTPVFRYLQCLLSEKYEIFIGKKPEWGKDFTATLIRRATVTCTSSKIIFFTNTRLKRALLKTEVKIGSSKLCILNTNLEKRYKGQVIHVVQQLQKCFDVCQTSPPDVFVVLGGSINLHTLEKIRGLKIPKNLIDMWESFGAKNDEFTCDLKVNKMIQFRNDMGKILPTSAQPQNRFSRLYIRKALDNNLVPRSFRLIGKQIVAGDKYCASEHWGLLAEFDVSPACYRNLDKKDSNVNQGKSTKQWKADFLKGEDEDDIKAAPQEENVKDNWDDSD